MVFYHIVALLAFLAIVAAFLIRYVSATVDREFRNLARAETDSEYRKEELNRLDRLLTTSLPLSPDTRPIPGSPGTWTGVAPTFLFVVGIILLWGGLVAAPGDRRLWLTAGALSTAASAAIMLATLRRRKVGRLVRLLRSRADLRRLDANNRGTADDLSVLLKLTPWDDAAWSELAEAKAALGETDAALAAFAEASKLDPGYEDYYTATADLLLASKRQNEMQPLLEAWEKGGGEPGPEADARRLAYRAAASLADGDIAAAGDFAAKARRLDNDAFIACIDMHEALREVENIKAGSAER